MIYLFIALIFLLSSFIEVFCNNNKTHKDIVLLSSFLIIILIVVAATRECGYDYINYRNYFDILHSPFWNNQSDRLSVETSFGFLCYILPSYRLLVLLFAVISLSILFCFIYANSPYPIFSIFILLGICFYSTYMGQFRQGLAMSIVLLSFMGKQKKYRFLLNLFACIFHITAVLGFLQFFFDTSIRKGKFYIVFLLIALAVNLTCYEVLIKIIPMMPGFIAAKLSFYVATEKGMTLGLNMAMLLRLTFFAIFYFYRYLIDSDKTYDKYFNLYFVSLLIYLGFGFLPQISGRGGLYFNILEIILSAKLLNAMPKGKDKYIVYFIFVAVSIYRQLSLFTSELGASLFLPYKTWLF